MCILLIDITHHARHSQAMPARTQCLLEVLPAVARAHSHACGRLVAAFLPELILASNEVSRRTREAAAELLVALGRAVGATQFVCACLGGLAGSSAHMQVGPPESQSVRLVLVWFTETILTGFVL